MPLNLLMKSSGISTYNKHLRLRWNMSAKPLKSLIWKNDMADYSQLMNLERKAKQQSPAAAPDQAPQTEKRESANAKTLPRDDAISRKSVPTTSRSRDHAMTRYRDAKQKT